jgi:hypothetical protein
MIKKDWPQKAQKAQKAERQCDPFVLSVPFVAMLGC